jgi:hypothetical protein
MKKAVPDSVPPTNPKILAVLILILICLMIATGKAAFYPGQPSAWARLHEPQSISVADANKLLSDSGAYIESIKPAADITTETWNMKHRTGTWAIIVIFKKGPKGDVIQSVHMRCEISHFPSCTRTWDYPPGTAAPASIYQPAKAPSPPATTASVQN